MGTVRVSPPGTFWVFQVPTVAAAAKASGPGGWDGGRGGAVEREAAACQGRALGLG